MQKTFTVENIGKVTLTDRDFLASGGEAECYAKNGLVYKLYHDPNRLVETKKIDELRKIQDDHVLKPLNIIYNAKGQPIGFAMTHQKNTEPICKYFTKSFKNQNNIVADNINDIVIMMQRVLKNIHKANCLVVDLNELNVLIQKHTEPYFIDVDSYQTPSYHATAIMDSIRDRMIHNNRWTEGSDWFSFAIIAFQLYIGIHPYKGKHPNYKPDEWGLRMEQGVSVFDKDVSLPKVCDNFNVIPQSHLNWFKDIFIQNKRYSPPEMVMSLSKIVVPDQFRFITSNAAFEQSLYIKIREIIKDVFNIAGVNYFVGAAKLYRGDSELTNDVSYYKNVALCYSGDIYPVICKTLGNSFVAEELNGKNIQSLTVDGSIVRNGNVYIAQDDNVVEITYRKYTSNVIASLNIVATINTKSALFLDGVIFHYLLGKTYMVTPYENMKCINIAVKELDGFRIVSAKSVKNVCVVMAEKAGKYNRFVIQFNKDYSDYNVRDDKDVSYCDVNLTVMSNGVALLATEDSVQIFKDNSVKTVDDPPFDSTTKLFEHGGKIHYIDGNSVYVCKLK